MTTSATSTEIASPELLTPPDPGGVMSLSGAPALTSRGVRGTSYPTFVLNNITINILYSKIQQRVLVASAMQGSAFKLWGDTG